MDKISDAIYQLTIHIANDLLQPIKYLPLGIFISCIFLFLWNIYNKERYCGKNPSKQNRKWILFLCITYITVLLQLAIFSREPGSRIGVDLGLFATWGNSTMSQAYFIENIIMFLPFGILFPLGFNKFKIGRYCVMIGFLFSVCLELLQFLTKRGYCQLDDIVTNTFGTVLGWGIYRLGVYFYPKHILPTGIRTTKNKDQNKNKKPTIPLN